MEFAAAAFSAVAGAVSSVGSAVGGVASSIGSAIGIGSSGGSLLGAVGGASTVASILSGGATIASALAAQRAGAQAALSSEFSAQDAEVEGRQEAIAGMERRNSLRRALIDQIAEQDTAYAASGVDLSFGTPATARAEASDAAERALTLDQSTEDIRRSRLNQKAANLRVLARQQRTGGLAKSAGLILDGTAQAIRRG